MNTTKMTQFKSALYSFEGFSKEQISSSTLVRDIDNSIKLLLNDKKMMMNKNHFNFEQRTNSTIIFLFRNLVNLAFSGYEEDKNKLQELNDLISNLPIEIEATQI